MARHTLARSLHDVGLATWFGGSLMGAVGLNGAAATLSPEQRASTATAGWSRWAPVSTVGIGAHLVGAVRLLVTERGRIARQDGVARSSAVKTALTAAALGTTAYSGALNRKMAAAGNVPAAGATEPAATTPPDVAAIQKQLRAVQWLIPGLTGSLISVSAWQSEQMRPRQVLRGSLPSLPSTDRLPALAGAGAGAALIITLLRKRSTGRTESSHDQLVTDMAAGSRTRDTDTTTRVAEAPVNPIVPTGAAHGAAGQGDGLVVTTSTS